MGENRKLNVKCGDGFFKRVTNVLFLVGIVFSFIGILMFFNDQHHFYYSYLTSFVFYLTLTLGCLFFVLIHHVTRAGWSVVVRRISEHVMKNIYLMALLFIPVLLGLHELYHWAHHDAVLHDAILQGKVPFLNVPFFLFRAFVFFGLWIYLVHWFYTESLAQDKDGKPARTLAMQKYATVGLIVYALSQSFGFVDWVMSLTPHWYSTMFGVYFFAGSVVSSFAFITLICLFFRSKGVLKDIVTVEHYHDLGKLMYGFNIFWAYIAFSQYFLIWYANVPEETVWFAQHFQGSWNTVAAVLAIGHFGIPFVLFMSRHAKRNLFFHGLMACWILAMHFLDMYWVIMPNVSPTGIHFSLLDLSCFLGIGGIFCAVLLYSLRQTPLIPIKDPRLDESLSFHNY